MPEELASQAAALARIQEHLEKATERVLIGIIGKPGAGKSTLSKFLMSKLPKEFVTVVPMDGYHLSNKVLKELKRADRKGAPDTFDVAGFVSLVKRIRSEQTHNIYYPIFDNSIEAVIYDMVNAKKQVIATVMGDNQDNGDVAEEILKRINEMRR